MSDITNGVGGDIRQFRESWDVGLRELARQIDRSPSWLSKVERGVEKPGEEAIVRIGAALEWSQFKVDTVLLKLGIVPADCIEALQQNPHLLNVLRRAVEKK